MQWVQAKRGHHIGWWLLMTATSSRPVLGGFDVAGPGAEPLHRSSVYRTQGCHSLCYCKLHLPLLHTCLRFSSGSGERTFRHERAGLKSLGRVPFRPCVLASAVPPAWRSVAVTPGSAGAEMKSDEPIRTAVYCGQPQCL